jgi:hypothetical protein
MAWLPTTEASASNDSGDPLTPPDPSGPIEVIVGAAALRTSGWLSIWVVAPSAGSSSRVAAPEESARLRGTPRPMPAGLPSGQKH